VDETVKAAILFAVGRAAGASGPVAALAEGVMRTMFLARLKTAALLLAALLGASLGIVATLAGPSPSGQDPGAPEKPKTRPRDQGPEVAVETVKRSEWTRTTSQPGNVQAFDSADVYARVPGYLKTLTVDIGSRVKKGETLAEIEAPEVAADAERARAEVDHAQVRLKRARAALQVAQAARELEHAKVQAADAAKDAAAVEVQLQKITLEHTASLQRKNVVGKTEHDTAALRYESAVAGSKGALSQVSVAQSAEAEARAKVDMARADADAAAIDVRIAQAGLVHANDLVAHARIVAPYDGVVTRRTCHVGELVGSPSTGKMGPLFTIVRTDLMRVVVHVPASETPLLNLGDPARIRIDLLGPDAVLEGRVARTGYELDPVSHNLRVEIDLPNTDGRLRPGQTGRVEIRLGTPQDVISIPTAAITERDENVAGRAACLRFVDGATVRTSIIVGDERDGRVEVLAGLKEGDRVAIPRR
jgi:multidrug efflux pump subunit AcrA (membrane-fusion protein)